MKLVGEENKARKAKSAAQRSALSATNSKNKIAELEKKLDISEAEVSTEESEIILVRHFFPPSTVALVALCFCSVCMLVCVYVRIYQLLFTGPLHPHTYFLDLL